MVSIGGCVVFSCLFLLRLCDAWIQALARRRDVLVKDVDIDAATLQMDVDHVILVALHVRFRRILAPRFRSILAYVHVIVGILFLLFY